MSLLHCLLIWFKLSAMVLMGLEGLVIIGHDVVVVDVLMILPCFMLI